MERRRTGGLPVHLPSGQQSLSSSRYLPGTRALVALNLAALLLLNLGYVRQHAAVTPPPVLSVTPVVEQRTADSFPKLLHQMHAWLSCLSALEVLLSVWNCMESTKTTERSNVTRT